MSVENFVKTSASMSFVNLTKGDHTGQSEELTIGQIGDPQ